jgi:ABC-type arginine transport system permease subunit
MIDIEPFVAGIMTVFVVGFIFAAYAGEHEDYDTRL